MHFAVRLFAALAIFLAVQGASASRAAVEFYNAELDAYFMTADQPEITALQGGIPAGWAETGYAFPVDDRALAGNLPVCRFFSASFAPRSSHFYTPYAEECAGLKAGAVWSYESIAFYWNLPGSDGTCGSGQTAIYRLYNNGASGAPK